jgi:hypothetical protein
MFGYMDQNKAIQVGFTHQGKYYGIPLWITDSQRPMIVAKWYPMEHIISFLQQSEVFIKSRFFPSRKHRHQLTNVKAIGS